MSTNVLAVAASLSDDALLSRLGDLCRQDRVTTVEIVAHLAELDARPSVLAARSYASLFTYCTRALGFSEDVACNRIAAARACRRFPVVADLLASGAITVSAVRLLHKHLTVANHVEVLARARGRSQREIEALVAELAPQPDAPSTLRKLPEAPLARPATVAPSPAASVGAPILTAAEPTLPVFVPPAHRPVVKPSAPERYRVQFTIGTGTHDKLRRLQALLRHQIPDGDPAAIFDRALTLLLDKEERAKAGGTATRGKRIRHVADRNGSDSRRRSRYISRAVRRAVWRRDGGQCAFRSATGLRCTERTFLHFHHLIPWALGGPSTVENIALRCRRHNQYEAELVFGDRALLGRSAETPPSLGGGPERQAAPPIGYRLTSTEASAEVSGLRSVSSTPPGG